MNETIEKKRNYNLFPTFGDSYGTGWNVMLDNFLRLLLVVFVLALLTGPLNGMKFNLNEHDFGKMHWDWWDGDWRQIFGIASLGAIAIFIGLLAIAYAFLALPVVTYGAKMIFLESVRRKKPDFEWLIKGFWTNYLNIVLANLLKFALVAIGLFALIIPGIIIACRLAFVPYLVMDRKLDPIESVELSWKMTRGHGWTIFLMGAVSFFIYLFGLILFLVGVLISDMWVKSAFASLYESVHLEKEKKAEAVEEAA
ncbi:MAG TPA: hypothetical protein PLV06_09815 [Bacteroidales bacterium]|nr:hypothetical protein [Bacteroidales bacterium]HPF04137.1 hypothetical protein [Bacteroidales bacterium]HPJ60686.1 hypothetical protein [Bacteroidales bacterium]HPR12668.1 hypothetical protein [Bacteroidales bacterium]HRW84647.1 hypothetical protein [Bacteroidales bacterium]